MSWFSAPLPWYGVIALWLSAIAIPSLGIVFVAPAVINWLEDNYFFDWLSDNGTTLIILLAGISIGAALVGGTCLG